MRELQDGNCGVEQLKGHGALHAVPPTTQSKKSKNAEMENGKWKQPASRSHCGDGVTVMGVRDQFYLRQAAGISGFCVVCVCVCVCAAMGFELRAFTLSHPTSPFL
jgi:hypothetical protein